MQQGKKKFQQIQYYDNNIECCYPNTGYKEGSIMMAQFTHQIKILLK